MLQKPHRLLLPKISPSQREMSGQHPLGRASAARVVGAGEATEEQTWPEGAGMAVPCGWMRLP